MNRICSLLLLFAGFSVLSLRAVELDAILQDPQAFWDMPYKDFSKRYPGFVDLDAARKRFAPDAKNELSLFGHSLAESILTQERGKTVSLSFNFYNRGDSEELNTKDFSALVVELFKQFQALSGPRIKPRRNTTNLNGDRIYSWVWCTEKMDILLRTSVSSANQRGEFIIAELYLPGRAPQNIRNSMKVEKRQGELGQNLKIGPDSSRSLLLPMVDQGGKGYCVAATVERVLRYYGAEIDQHILAEIAETDADNGTDLQTALEALSKNRRKLGISIDMLYRCRYFDSFDNVIALVKLYNSAEKDRKKRLNPKDYITREGNSKILNLTALMKDMNSKTLETMRAKESVPYSRFQKELKKSIEAGIPLCWGTFFLPTGKEQPQIAFHMRIINGYNPVTNDVIFSDSWGKDHERKLMPMQEAWSITFCMFQIKPTLKQSRPIESDTANQ